METYCRGRMPLPRALTLGCGHGELERGLAKYHFALEHDAVDLSEAAIADATRLSRAAGMENVHYKVANLNSIQLPENSYDVVFGISSVHHTAGLEHLFEQVAGALRPDGYFFLDEFIGPTQFQWTSAQLEAINNALAAMPPAYRRCVDQNKGVKEPVERYTIEEMNRIDPTEAIRSAEIMPLLPQYFDVVEVRGYGGTLLHLLLDDIAGNFMETDPASMRYLESLFEMEDRMIESGRLPHDFAVIIARKKET
jgi:SAM-dependent methyltransferase